MATRPPMRPLASLLPRRAPPARAPRRAFLDGLLPSDRPLTIRATRTLPYPRPRLYDLIVDVDAYAEFLPYCRRSRVTAWSAPDGGEPDPSAPPSGARRRWPVEGELTVGLGPLAQSYTSRIACVPGRSVEARSGRDELPPGGAGSRSNDGNNPFRRLVTRWTVEDAPAPAPAAGGGAPAWTRVDLELSMRLADPLAQAVMSRLADESATKMIEAFERRARELFGPGR